MADEDEKLWLELYGEAPPDTAEQQHNVFQYPPLESVDGSQFTSSSMGSLPSAPAHQPADQASTQGAAVMQNSDQLPPGPPPQQQEQQQQLQHAMGAHAQQMGMHQQHMHQQQQMHAGQMAPQDDLELVMETDVVFASTYVAHHGHNRHPAQAADEPATADDFLVMPSEMPQPKAPVVATPSKYQAPPAVSDAVIRERRKAVDARSRMSAKSGITVAAPPIQPGLVAIDYAQVQPPPSQKPDWEAPAMWPSEAGPHNPIKLPRQTKVQQAEYKEFLALGHGDIFDLDVMRTVVLDKMNEVRPPPWHYAGCDLSDYFNYGMDPESWRFYCAIIDAYRKRYCLMASAEDAAVRPVIDENEDDLPHFRRNGVAHPVANFDPFEDSSGTLPTGLRLPRDHPRRNLLESKGLWVSLVDCDCEESERLQGPPIDYGSWNLFGPLGMANISDFEHYHYNPEADEMKKEAMLSMYGMAMESLNPGAAPTANMKTIEGGEQHASLMGDDFPSTHQKALAFGGMDGVGAMGDPGTSTGAAMAFKGPDLMSQAAAGQDDLMSGKAPPAAELSRGISHGIQNGGMSNGMSMNGMSMDDGPDLMSGGGGGGDLMHAETRDRDERDLRGDLRGDLRAGGKRGGDLRGDLRAGVMQGGGQRGRGHDRHGDAGGVQMGGRMHSGGGYGDDDRRGFERDRERGGGKPRSRDRSVDRGAGGVDERGFDLRSGVRVSVRDRGAEGGAPAERDRERDVREDLRRGGDGGGRVVRGGMRGGLMGEDLRRDSGDHDAGGGDRSGTGGGERRERKREREFDDRDRESRDLRGETRRRGDPDEDTGGTRGGSGRGEVDLRRGGDRERDERGGDRKVRNFGIEREDDDGGGGGGDLRGGNYRRGGKRSEDY